MESTEKLVSVHTCQLAVKPNSAEQSLAAEHDDQLYSLFLNGELVSDTVQPFSASSPVVELFACSHCGMPGDGSGFFEVRRLGNHILWMDKDDPLDSGKTKRLKPRRTYLFDAPSYNRALQAGDSLDLPLLSTDQLRSLISNACPDPTLALYLVPEQLSDEFGTNLLERIWAAFTSEVAEKLLIVDDSPEIQVEMRIGLDLEGVPECRWLIGKSQGNTVAMPLSHPPLPLWLGGEPVRFAFDRLQLEANAPDWRSIV